MKNYFLIFCFLIFNISCVHNNKNLDNEKDSIDLNRISQISVFDFIESIDVIQLETNDESLISTIQKIVFYDDKYYIFDRKQMIILCFDDKGDYLFKIKAMGQGPEEYIVIGDFVIDSYNNYLLILDEFGRSLLTFDLSGHFLSKIKLPSRVIAYNEVYPLNKDTLIFVSINNEYQLVYYSKRKQDIVDERYKSEKYADRQAMLYPTSQSYTNNESVFYNPPITNTIINLSNNSEYVWNFGSSNNSIKQIQKFKKLDGNVTKDYVTGGYLNYTFNYNYESTRYRFCSLYAGNYKCKYVFIDKKEDKYFVFEKNKEGINFLVPDFSGDNILMYDRGLIENPFIDIAFYNPNTLSEEQKIILERYNPEIDNPFIIRYQLKK